MKNYALIGFPLGHSLSPQIHGRLFSLAGIQADYKLTEIPPEELQNRFEELKKLDGFNVTIPHKINIIKMCDELSEGAARYGSVNCIKNSGGKTVGYNTDVLGFVKSVEQMGASLSSRVCLLGCGGVGRMMAVEAAYQGAELDIAVRDADIPVAEGIKADIAKILPQRKVKVLRLAEMSSGYDLVVNATPVGMYPNTDNSPLEKSQLRDVKFLFDAVYNPTETKLAKYARELGIKACTGMSMLVLQAVAAQEIWNGSEFDVKEIEKLIADMEALV